jgi:hypothetical protein
MRSRHSLSLALTFSGIAPISASFVANSAALVAGSAALAASSVVRTRSS